MPKVTIDVELGELEKEWDAVAIRVPKVGDDFVNSNGEVNRCQNTDWKQPRLIVRRKIVWPSWCKGAAICKDMDGLVYAYSAMPSRGGSSWLSCGCDVQQLKPRLVDFKLPDDHNWTIPILNPNYKEPSGS